MTSSLTYSASPIHVIKIFFFEGMEGVGLTYMYIHIYYFSSRYMWVGMLVCNLIAACDYKLHCIMLCN